MAGGGTKRSAAAGSPAEGSIGGAAGGGAAKPGGGAAGGAATIAGGGASFELFVVVVAVDVEWVEAAVARSIEFAGPDSDTDEAKDEDRRKRAIKYLAKIFQLPFWLKPFAGKDDLRYGKYVRSLTRAAAAAPPPPPPPAAGDAPPGKSKDSPPADNDKDESGTDEAEAPASGDTEPPSAAGAETEAHDPVAVARALRTLQLTKAEEDFLAGPEISALAAADPRGVKRLVNVYKIARARLSETDDDIILGGAGRAAAYPIIALCAAVETGQPLSDADSFYDAVKQNEKAAQLALTTTPEIAAALAAAAAARGACPISGAEALNVARVVRRYSFNRYH